MKSSNQITPKKSIKSEIDFTEGEKIFTKDSFCDKKAVARYINELMIKKNLILASEVYKRAGISKQTWSHIFSEQTCPTQENARRLVIGLKCTLPEAEQLLAYCGMCFVPGNHIDDCFKACIQHEIFNMVDVQLYMSGQWKTAFAA